MTFPVTTSTSKWCKIGDSWGNFIFFETVNPHPFLAKIEKFLHRFFAMLRLDSTQIILNHLLILIFTTAAKCIPNLVSNFAVWRGLLNYSLQKPSTIFHLSMVLRAPQLFFWEKKPNEEMNGAQHTHPVCALLAKLGFFCVDWNPTWSPIKQTYIYVFVVLSPILIWLVNISAR